MNDIYCLEKILYKIKNNTVYFFAASLTPSYRFWAETLINKNLLKRFGRKITLIEKTYYGIDDD